MTEISWPLRQAMYHFGSGDALFLGLFLLCLATRAEMWNRPRRLVSLLTFVGFTWIVLSAWPGVWLTALMASFALVWLMARRERRRIVARRLLVALILTSALYEFGWQRPVRLHLSATPAIAIIGDSVTAGLETTDFTWPQQVAERFGWTVFDASQQGATVRTALQQLHALDGRGELLVMEIGGIDVLEQTPVAEYRRHLAALLEAARPRYRTVVMTEIALPPLCNGYGIAQRELAVRYQVRLIPKRELIGVLTSAGATVDGIHLSDSGQTQLAGMMHRVIGGTATSVAGRYKRCEPSQPEPAPTVREGSGGERGLRVRGKPTAVSLSLASCRSTSCLSP